MPDYARDTRRAQDERRAANRERARTLLPDLRVRVYARPEGVHVVASIETLRPEGHRGQETIADVVFRPREVTEALVVQWAIGALSTWLQTKAEESVRAEPSAS